VAGGGCGAYGGGAYGGGALGGVHAPVAGGCPHPGGGAP